MAESTLPNVVNAANVEATVQMFNADASSSGYGLGSNTYVAGSYFPSYRPNPTEAAFKIVGKMMEQGLVGEMDVTQFVKIVNDVAEIVRTS